MNLGCVCANCMLFSNKNDVKGKKKERKRNPQRQDNNQGLTFQLLLKYFTHNPADQID